MKVVINNCFGGFGISMKALMELVLKNAKCIHITTPKEYYGGSNPKFNRNDWEERWKADFDEYKDIGDGFMAHPSEFNLYKDGLLYSIDDRNSTEVRTDKDLIEVVEKMGEASHGQYASLKIVEIPDGIEWQIDEYDGNEQVEEKHRTWS